MKSSIAEESLLASTACETERAYESGGRRDVEVLVSIRAVVDCIALCRRFFHVVHFRYGMHSIGSHDPLASLLTTQ